MAKSRNAKKGRRRVSTKSRSAQRAKSSPGRSSRRATARNGAARDDAIALLKADHREVERMFGDFEKARSDDRKRELSEQICLALRTHTTIEEEIFYPAFLEATDETDIHHEAEVEHAGAKHLIDEIESGGSEDDHFEARVSVLKEMIKHHVKEEEQRGGMFSKAQSSDMDLRALGQRLKERKLELMGEADDGGGRRQLPPQSRSRFGGRDMRMRSS
jgi:hemerythrin superfamily protein